MSKVMRSVKNVTKGYSSAQVKVREGQNLPAQAIRIPGSPSLTMYMQPPVMTHGARRVLR